MISPADLNLYLVTDNCQEALDEVLQFFRVYHSMRYVGGNLVLRLVKEIPPEMFEAINRDFTDILADGKFVQSGPLEEEKNEPELSSMTRLVFKFDRRNHGRLRQMINLINSMA